MLPKALLLQKWFGMMNAYCWIAQKSQKMKKALFPSRHGETGTSVSEMYYFSRFRWAAFFRGAGWTVERYCTNRLFYIEYGLFDPTLSIPAHQRLASCWEAPAMSSS